MFGKKKNQPISQMADLRDECLNILNVIPDIVYKIDAKGKFTFVSNSITQLGYSPEEMIGKHFSIILHPDDVPVVSRDSVLPRFSGRKTGDAKAPKLMDERRSGARSTRNLVIRIIPKNVRDCGENGPKSTIPVEVAAAGHYQETEKSKSGEFQGTVGTISQVDGLKTARDKMQAPSKIFGKLSTVKKYSNGIRGKKLIGTVGIIRDVSERMHMEAENRKLVDQLHHTKKMQAIGELAGGITHDFNNLLGIIRGHTELINLKSKSGNSDLEKHTGIILSAVNDAAELTAKLLAFARKGKYTNVALDIHRLIKDIIQMLDHSLHKDIHVQMDLEAERPYCLGDENQIKNALINIAINARDAMPIGGELAFQTVNLPFEKVPSEKSAAGKFYPEYLCIKVRDTGTGMDDDTREKIFEPYFTTKGHGKGSGLGLACVQGIVEKHDGFIKVESQMGNGSEFRLFMPVSAAPVGKAQEKPGGVNGNTFRFRRVLIVDDEKRVLSANTEMLQASGLTVKAFQAGMEALTWYRTHVDDIDIALLDIMMPGMNGIDCFKKMKEVNPGIRTVLMTGFSLEEDTQEIVRDPNVRFLQKPFTLGGLMETIHGLQF